MKTKFLLLSATTSVILSLAPSVASAWGCSRSASASGARGSVSHSSSTSGGYGSFSHSGSTTATGRYGNTYSTSHSGSGNYGYGAAVAAGVVVGAAAATAATQPYPYAPGLYYHPLL